MWFGKQSPKMIVASITGHRLCRFSCHGLVKCNSAKIAWNFGPSSCIRSSHSRVRPLVLSVSFLSSRLQLVHHLFTRDACNDPPVRKHLRKNGSCVRLIGFSFYHVLTFCTSSLSVFQNFGLLTQATQTQVFLGQKF